MERTPAKNKVAAFIKRMRTPRAMRTHAHVPRAAVHKSLVAYVRGAVAAHVASKFSLKQQTFFAKRLAFLINAGVPVLESLYILRDQTGTLGHSHILDQIIDDSANGQALSKSFAKFPKIFSQFAIHIIKVGESSGTLSQNLEYLSEELKQRQLLRRKVVSAFIYPVLITVATFGITGFLMLYLFPKIMPIFTSLHMELPLSTRVVIFLSTFFHNWGLALIAVVSVVTVAGIYAVRTSERVHYLFDSLMLRVPVIGRMLKYYNVANASRTLGLLLSSGTRLSEALHVTAETTPNLVYREYYQSLGGVVNRGEKLSVFLLKHQDHFPDVFSHMVAVGERSGTLSDTLVYLSEMYDAEVDDFTKNLSTLVEPALMIFMGIMVGFIAISIITPIYGITQNLHG